jgi:N-acetylglutamate synthase-like GNAT family acetyltransferase
MIRPATAADVPELVDMLIAFQAEAGCYAHVDPCKESLSRFVGNMTDNPGMAPIAIYEKDGAIAGSTAMLAQPSWFNDQQVNAQEMWWYIKPEYRGSYAIPMRLFKWLEQWAVEHKVKSLTVCSTATLNVGKLEDFYTRRGFVKADVFYIKEV